MTGINCFIGTGNAVADAEYNVYEGNRACAKFTIAINRSYKRPGEDKWHQEVSFIPVTVWGQQAAYIGKNVKKGTPLIVQGRIDMSRWQTKDGANRQRLFLTATKVMLSSKRQQASEYFGETEDRNTPADGKQDDELPYDECPF
jgi:single-strand DNA-binding protein